MTDTYTDEVDRIYKLVDQFVGFDKCVGDSDANLLEVVSRIAMQIREGYNKEVFEFWDILQGKILELYGGSPQKLAKLRKMWLYTEGLWLVFGPTNVLRGAHVALNVRGDGSCFYQALYYSMVLYHPEARTMLVERIPSLHGFKMMIYNKMYNEDGDFQYWDFQLEAVQGFMGVCGTPMKELLREQGGMFDTYRIRATPENKDATIQMDSNIAKMYLGILDTRRSDRSKYGREYVFEMAALAFDVQIVVYSADGAYYDKEVKWAEKKYATGGFTVNGCYTGQKVLLMLHSGSYRGGHFYILGGHPLLEGMNLDGTGTPGIEIPSYIRFVDFSELNKLDDHVVMPLLA